MQSEPKEISEFCLEQIEIQKLSSEHNTLDFDCYDGYEEDKDLNDFIKNDALNERYEGWNQTYVAIKKGTKDVVGFFSISNESFEVRPEIKKEKNKPYQQIPATKIARLAVDNNHQNKGLGTFLVKFAIGFIVDQICKNSGCRYITVDAYPHRVDWYKNHFDFTENVIVETNSNRCINLILDLKDFEKKLKK